MTSGQPNPEILGEVFRKMDGYAEIIGAKRIYLPCSGGPIENATWIDFDKDNATYRYLYMERGEISLLKATTDLEELLEAVFDSVTNQMAYGDLNQVALLRKLNPAWADRKLASIAAARVQHVKGSKAFE